MTNLKDQLKADLTASMKARIEVVVINAARGSAIFLTSSKKLLALVSRAKITMRPRPSVPRLSIEKKSSNTSLFIVRTTLIARE